MAKLVAGPFAVSARIYIVLVAPATVTLVAFLADHPVTGGYPVIAVLHSSALDKAGQLAPDQVVRFVRASGSTPQ